jgi:hypothetical protein
MILKSRGRSEKWSGKDIFYHGLLFFLDLYFQKEISIVAKLIFSYDKACRII